MKEKMYKSKTIFCDIDGTLIKHHGSLSKQITNKPEILEGTLKINLVVKLLKKLLKQG